MGLSDRVIWSSLMTCDVYIQLPLERENADPEIVLPILRVIGSRLPGENLFSS